MSADVAYNIPRFFLASVAEQAVLSLILSHTPN